MNSAIHPALPLSNLKQGVASTPARMYRPVVAANSATGFGDPISKRRIGAPMTIAGAFFALAASCYGGCARETFGSAGFRLPRFANLRTAATIIRLATIRGSSIQVNGAVPVQDAIAVPVIRIRAAAHRAMAIAALHADSSLATRLKRYNAAMAKARALEAAGGAL
ncbi:MULTISPECIES: hypothetical protein [Pseudomonas]|uniref:hypothetical protein n=1 Tax=Pseudomonas TaxID=286 RepID=UPI00168AB6E4|nr:hypothetical protein [Pseudomonas putida]QNL86138.1 Uncharacterized protein PPKH_0724 [Pseudomonas putida]